MKYNTDMFVAQDGLKLFEQTWGPETEPRATVILVHGLAEHSGRYQHVAEHLVGHGYRVAAFDLRGHGRSDGKKGYVKSFDHYLADLEQFLARIQSQNPGQRLFLLGHSMGGAIVLLYTITQQPNVSGLIVSGPAAKVSDTISPLLVKVSALVGRLFPYLPTVKIPSTVVSHDLNVIRKRDADDLVLHGGTLARTGAELIRASKRIQSQMEAIRLPLLILHGGEDQLADLDGSQQLYQRAQATDKTLKIYDGFYHEVFNEIDKDRVLADLAQWLNDHCQD